MKLPRDVGGRELADLLTRYGYEITRQTGNHLRLTSAARGTTHHVTLPDHKPLKIGTLSTVLSDVARYLELDKQELARKAIPGTQYSTPVFTLSAGVLGGRNVGGDAIVPGVPPRIEELAAKHLDSSAADGGRLVGSHTSRTRSPRRKHYLLTVGARSRRRIAKGSTTDLSEPEGQASCGERNRVGHAPVHSLISRRWRTGRTRTWFDLASVDGMSYGHTGGRR